MQKSFQLIFYNFIALQKKKKSFEYPSQQPTVLFSIYQNNTWTIRRLVDVMIDPATQPIILKIVGFKVGIPVRAEIELRVLLSIYYRFDLN